MNEETIMLLARILRPIIMIIGYTYNLAPTILAIIALIMLIKYLRKKNKES